MSWSKRVFQLCVDLLQVLRHQAKASCAPEIHFSFLYIFMLQQNIHTSDNKFPNMHIAKKFPLAIIKLPAKLIIAAMYPLMENHFLSFNSIASINKKSALGKELSPSE